MIDLAALTASDFESWADRPFTARGPDGEAMELTVAEVHGGRAPSGRRAPFSVLFHAPARPVLAQDLHELTHPDAGTLHLFLVPMVPRDGCARYEAVFT